MCQLFCYCRKIPILQTQSLVYVVDRAEMLEKEIQESVQDADQSEADKNEDNIPPS